MKPNYEFIQVGDCSDGVQYIGLNRPDKRNAINNRMRGELLQALQQADADEAVRVSIIYGEGDCFSSGYDIKSDLNAEQPYHTPNVGSQWARHVGEGWMSIWDLAKPVIARVHGYAMAGGLELVGACDLAYGALDASFSHPVLGVAGLPDFAWFPHYLNPRDAMELHIAGRVYKGEEAAAAGLINRAFAADQLAAEVQKIALHIAATPAAVVTVNKRCVHAALEARGTRSSIRQAADLQAGPHMQALLEMKDNLAGAIKERAK